LPVIAEIIFSPNFHYGKLTAGVFSKKREKHKKTPLHTLILTQIAHSFKRKSPFSRRFLSSFPKILPQKVHPKTAYPFAS